MRHKLSDLRRRALGLQRAGLYPYAERALLAWRAGAERQGAKASVTEAVMRTIGLELDRDRPAAALGLGAEVLPKVLGTRVAPSDVRARLYLFLAKAAWRIGRNPEMRAFFDAAQATVAHEAVEDLVRVHLGVMATLVALEGDDLDAALSWALQALDIARAVGDEATVTLGRLNVAYLRTQRGELDRADATIADLLMPGAGASDIDLVDVLVNAVHIALGQGNLVRAGGLARRAVAAYCEAPSLLSPISVAYLFEALACYHAASGAPQPAELLALTARGWFALRHRTRDVLRVERWLADLPRTRRGPMAGGGDIEPEALYLGDLFAGAYRSPGGATGRALAMSVHRLLREIAPEAPAAACEHAALLRPLTAGERWFTGRSALGRAAERLLSTTNAPGKAALDLLAAYEGLGTSGASWAEALRGLRRAGSDGGAITALDRLYREATA